MQVFDKLWVGLAAYLLVIAGTIFLGTKLLPLVAVNTLNLHNPTWTVVRPRSPLSNKGKSTRP